MLQDIKHKLSLSIGEADKTIDAVTKALDEILSALLSLSECSNDLPSDGKRPTNSDTEAQIACLQKIKDQINDIRFRYQLITKQLDRISRYTGKGSDPTVIRMTLDETVHTADEMSSLASRLSQSRDDMYSNAVNVFANDMDALTDCLDRFGQAAAKLSEAFYDAANELSLAEKLYYRMNEETILGFPGIDGDNRHSGFGPSASPTYAQASQEGRSPSAPSPAPPPLCSARNDNIPSDTLYGSPYEQNKGKDRKKKRGGIFGLFGKKKRSLTGVNSCTPPPRLDSVQFSAIAPKKVRPGRYVPLYVVMFEDAFRSAVDGIIRSVGDETTESKGGYHNVFRNSHVRVVMSSPDVEIIDGESEQIWHGKYLSFQFTASVPSDYRKEQLLFSATVYVNGIIATKLMLTLDRDGKPRRNVSVSRDDVLSAFVSYASQDRNRVASIIQGMQKARPDMDIFFDIESLRSGQKWEDELKREIEARDVLFLCWSKFARESKWVDMEWRYAFENKGEDSIEPIPIDSPDVCPPPAELSNKHFNDKLLYIIKATSLAGSGKPCLLCLKSSRLFELDGEKICFGRSAELADAVIDGNYVISKRHAEIIIRNGKFYVSDLNSTHHTFVNGKVIPVGVEVPVEIGARIRFADEEFELVIS